MDDLDRKIIQILKKDARASITKVSKELGVPEATLYFRVNKLIKDGVIERFTIVLGHQDKDINAAFVYPKDYLISAMSERIIDNVGKDIAKHSDVIFAARIDDKVLVVWHGSEFNPSDVPGVRRVDNKDVSTLYKAC